MVRTSSEIQSDLNLKEILEVRAGLYADIIDAGDVNDSHIRNACITTESDMKRISQPTAECWCGDLFLTERAKDILAHLSHLNHGAAIYVHQINVGLVFCTSEKKDHNAE